MYDHRPLFRSAESAIAWAYETAARVPVKSVGIYAMGKPRVRSRLNLTPEEAHGQAALILSLVERVCDPIELAYVRAKFGRQFEALKRLSTVVIANLGTGIHQNRAIEKVLLMYMGMNIGIRALQCDLRISTAKTIQWKRDRFDMLDRIHRRAVGKLDEHLRAANVVGEY